MTSRRAHPGKCAEGAHKPQRHATKATHHRPASFRAPAPTATSTAPLASYYNAQRFFALLFHIWGEIRPLFCRCCLEVRSPPHRPCPSHTRVFCSPPLRLDGTHFTKNLPLTCSDGRHARCIPPACYSMHEMVRLHTFLAPQFLRNDCSCLSLWGRTAGALVRGRRHSADQMVPLQILLVL